MHAHHVQLYQVVNTSKFVAVYHQDGAAKVTLTSQEILLGGNESYCSFIFRRKSFGNILVSFSQVVKPNIYWPLYLRILRLRLLLHERINLYR